MVFNQTFPIVLIFLIGFVLKKAGILHKEDAGVISRLLLHVVLPATILHALSSVVISPSLLRLPGAAIAVVTTLLFIGFALAPLLGLQDQRRAAFLLAFPSLEIASIGYAFMAALYGSAGLALIILFDMGNALFFFLVLVPLASALSRSARRFQLLDATRSMSKNPVIWAYAIGMSFHLFHIQMPSLISHLCATVSQALLVLMMLLLALEFEFASFSFPALLVYLKMSIGVTIGLLISLLFGFTGAEQMAVVLASSLPACLLSVVYARAYGLDVEFLASMLSLALPIAIGFSFLLMSIAH
jgi:predicted permease